MKMFDECSWHVEDINIKLNEHLLKGVEMVTNTIVHVQKLIVPLQLELSPSEECFVLEIIICMCIMEHHFECCKDILQ